MKYYGTDNGVDYGFSSKKTRFKQCIEISDTLQQELLDGQANGKQIKTAEDGTPYLADVVTPIVDNQMEVLQIEIDALEKKQIRSLKAKVTSTATPEDESIYDEIEKQIKTKRQQINNLKQGIKAQ